MRIGGRRDGVGKFSWDIDPPPLRRSEVGSLRSFIVDERLRRWWLLDFGAEKVNATRRRFQSPVSRLSDKRSMIEKRQVA